MRGQNNDEKILFFPAEDAVAEPNGTELYAIWWKQKELAKKKYNRHCLKCYVCTASALNKSKQQLENDTKRER